MQPPVRANKQSPSELHIDNEGRRKSSKKPKVWAVESQKQRVQKEITTADSLARLYRTGLYIAEYCTQPWLLHHWFHSHIDKKCQEQQNRPDLSWKKLAGPQKQETDRSSTNSGRTGRQVSIFMPVKLRSIMAFYPSLCFLETKLSTC